MTYRYHWLLAVALAWPLTVRAQVVDLSPAGFMPAATIDLSTVPLGTNDPVFDLSAGGYGTVAISFGSYFTGQSLTNISAGLPITLATSTPSAPLTVASDPTNVAFTTTDDALPDPTTLVISGTPDFNGPIAIELSTPVQDFGLTAGYLNVPDAVAITAYNSAGASLGTVQSSAIGFQTFALSDPLGAQIAGLSIYPVSAVPGGFEIHDLSFGPAVPEPPALPVLLAALAGLFAVRRRWGGSSRAG